MRDLWLAFFFLLPCVQSLANQGVNLTDNLTNVESVTHPCIVCSQPSTASSQMAGVRTSGDLYSRLVDEDVSDIFLAGDVTLDAQAWTTVFITNRTIGIHGAGAWTLNFGNIPEAIVVEEDASLELHSITLVGQAGSTPAILGLYSRYRARTVLLWPSLVLLPGSQAVYNLTTSVTNAKMLLSNVSATMSALGLAKDFAIVNSTTYNVSGSHTFVTTVDDVVTGLADGTVVFQLSNVTVVSTAVDVSFIQDGNSKGGLQWWEGMLLGIAIGVLVSAIAFLIVKCLKRCSHKKFERFKDTELTDKGLNV